MSDNLNNFLIMPLAFGLGSPTEIAIIGGIIVLLFGGAKLAEFGRSAGQGIREFKRQVGEEDANASSAAPAPVPSAPTQASEDHSS